MYLWESEGSRTGQRDYLGADAATTEASASLMVELWSWTGLAELSPVGAKGPGFHTLVYQSLTRLPQGTGVWPWDRQSLVWGLSCELATPNSPHAQ